MTNEETYYLDRELSWLDFNARVLEEALRPDTPLFERLRFLSIFSSNLDEFFMTRVGGLYDRILLGDCVSGDKANLRPSEQLTDILARTRRLYKDRDAAFAVVCAALKEEGLPRRTVSSLTKKQRASAERFFRERLLPVLSPIIVDAKHPFPFLENNTKYLCVRFKTGRDKRGFGLARLAAGLGPVFFLGGDAGYVLCEDLLIAFARDIFSMYEVEKAVIARAARNAELDVREDLVDHGADFRKQTKRLLKKRARRAPVRLEIYRKRDGHIQDFFLSHTSVNKEQVFFSKSPLDYGYLADLEARLPRARRDVFFYRPHRPAWAHGLVRDRSLIDQVLRRDVLLHHPYDSPAPLVALLREAAARRDTVSIQITLYRLSADSQIIRELCQAAENGKQVTVTLELRARFDEQNNINWSSSLEEAGCHIIYGLEDVKVHAKLLLVTLRGERGIRRIVHIGTGNYNEKTARQYTDIGLLTAHPGIGREVKTLFDNIGLSHPGGEYRHLLVAPPFLRARLLSLIDGEIQKAARGGPGRIIAKMNGLTDKILIDKLLEASQAGVRISLIVRGVCCLRPGVPGLSENIEVVSIVGRFLEHARILCFGEGADRRLFISSADFMTRNMERRVEATVPIYDRAAANRLFALLTTQLADTALARRLLPDGRYVRMETDGVPVDSQRLFMENMYMPKPVLRNQTAIAAAGAARIREGPAHR